MAGYFAKLENDIVQQVVSATDAQWCIDNLGGEWVQTYYNTKPYNYAGVGYKYHRDKNNFSAPQPFPSWSLDENLIWQPPVKMPKDGKFYGWNEKLKAWELVKI